MNPMVYEDEEKQFNFPDRLLEIRYNHSTGFTIKYLPETFEVPCFISLYDQWLMKTQEVDSYEHLLAKGMVIDVVGTLFSVEDVILNEVVQ